MAQNATDAYKVVRGQIEHITNQMSQRVIWLVIAQSFFFNGYAVLVTGNPGSPDFIFYRGILVMVFPVAALFTVLLTYIDIIIAVLHKGALSRNFRPYSPDAEGAGYPPVDGFRWVRLLQNASTLALPLVFIIVWIYILCL